MSAKAKFAAITCGLVIGLSGAAHAAWQPAKPIEFIATAGPGGGTDNFARAVQSIITKHKLVEQPIVVTNKGGGSGAEGYTYTKGDGGRSLQDRVRDLERMDPADGVKGGL
jgi:tripartite-type tricarboxylate transporter receptor subunit TctC